MEKQKKPLVLAILDGWGVAAPSRGNAITLAKKPILDRLFEAYPSTTLGATGREVGLEDHKMSGSEAGHMNIGAGRIVKQDSSYITESIKNGSFFMNPALIGAIDHAKKHNSQFHIMGLMGNSDSPHSDPRHFQALLKLVKKNNLKKVYCHLFTDGRDSYPKSALEHLKKFQSIMAEEGVGEIATLSGRFYAMDRAKNWKRLTKAYDAMVFGRGEKVTTAEEAIEFGYRNGLTDEYILPTVILKDNQPVARIGENDSLVFYNLRSDRARQLTKLFVAINQERVIVDDMPIIDQIKNLFFVAMTDFGPDLNNHIIFHGSTLSATLPMVLRDFRQLYIAESEKYAHITYFLNGGYADPVDGEFREIIPSPKVDSYAKVPEMSAPILGDKVSEYMEKNLYDFIAVNFANADMVGHTGDIKATVRAVETVDAQIGKIIKPILKNGGTLVVTADHGNADDMIDFGVNQPNTFHSKNPVPFLIVNDALIGNNLRDGGVLGDIAPTVLEILNVAKPSIMNRQSLLH